ncbi:hypothetical protein LTR36_003169 [Oleoguttula mirabilis]|uniref:Meiotically up-regulated protein Msb1/Mug8 domain-containing protein n=1 Tax=Oleoguttula mirabilis TaxID=1507867 RepID=A0AAV9JWS6_9PEZI|nr:hypothetical protein LTR36_003169 [Oleoguttula mirabilis]
MPLFSRLKNKGANSASKAKSKAQSDLTNGKPVAPLKSGWESSWSSKTVVLEEVEELIHACTAEMKSRAEALDTPFLLLPFRPDSDAGGARSFVRNFYKSNAEGSNQYRGANLRQELRLTEPIVLCSIIKWCWSRIPNGVVTWPVYEGFQIGEMESNMARNAFHTFIPIGAGSEARKNIVFDFFDLLCAVAAHGKMNGLGGRKLSRLAGWWAFEHSDDGNGFVGGYKSWTSAADASSHLFFAYLRSLSPEADPSMSVIERIPRSLQALLASTEYPPETPTLMQRSTPRVVMLVDSVSPTPFALLRRAKHFEYRDNDRVLREYQEFEDPVDALTDECKRVLYAISSINSSAAPMSRDGEMAKTGQESWSAFQNLGFSDLDERALAQKAPNGMNGSARPHGQGLRAQPRSRNADYGRPTTPSWADFLSSGFYEDDVSKTPTTLSLPSQQRLPPLGSRAQIPSHMNGADDKLAPGELAAITNVDLDDAFWWVWMTSLAGEEPAEHKGVFGRCALIETTIQNGRWLIMEEQLKGASPDPAEGAYIAPKKNSIFSFTKRGKNKRTKSDKVIPETPEPIERTNSATPSKSSLAPDQHSRIKAAAAVLARKQNDLDGGPNSRRGRHDDAASVKTSSMATVGMMSEATPAMQWAKAYDKNAIRKQYLGDSFAGTGASSVNLASNRASSIFPAAPALTPQTNVFPADSPLNRELPAPPKEDQALAAAERSTSIQPAPRTEEPKAASAMRSKVPAFHVMPADAEQRQEEAEQVPLPEALHAEHPITALDKELAVESPTSPKGKVERKPVPRIDNVQDHPAFRQRSIDEPTSAPGPMSGISAALQPPQSPQSPAAIAAQKAMGARASSSSPESLQKQTVAKLKKQGGGGGLKKMFGRKKDNPNRNSVEVPRPASNKGLSPPSESSLGRRLSLMRKKPSSRGTPNASQIAVAQPSPEMMEEPTMPDSHAQFEQSVADVSQLDSPTDANPEEEFSRFDQGPMQEMPIAAAQVSEDEDLSAPAPQRQYNTQLASRIAPERQETNHDTCTTPAERGDPIDDAVSETTMEERPLSMEPAADRWAQIRENAAKRAARASEEQSMQSRPSHAQSTRETDDGETSGEETIESRVARIKARVAELTGGNIESSGAATARR